MQKIKDLKNYYASETGGEAQLITLSELVSFLGIEKVNLFLGVETQIRHALRTFSSRDYKILGDLKGVAKYNLDNLKLPKDIEGFMDLLDGQLLLEPISGNLLNYLNEK